MVKGAPQDKHPNVPYLSVVDQPRMMKGGPTQMVFGVLGHTKLDAPTRNLGGLVKNARPDAPVPEVRKESRMHVNTDRDILGPKAKTPMPGEHYGQVPYPGHFQSALGHKLWDNPWLLN